MKLLTIPRLELLGCLLLSKLINEILVGLQNRIQLEDIFCWTDSEVALCWINGKEKSWEPWVENRVVAIRKVVDWTKWNFVKGELNPADIKTYRLSSNLGECFSGCWCDGPVMLWSRVVECHAGRGDEISLFRREELEVLCPVVSMSNSTQKGIHNCKISSLSAVIDCTCYSSLKKLVLTTGHMMHFINNLRKQVKKQDNLVCDDVLTVGEYNEALHMWIRDEQSLMKEQCNYINLCASLRLFEDKDELLQLKGRFANTSLKHQEQHPIILQSKNNSYFSQLLIWDAHNARLHHGMETTFGTNSAQILDCQRTEKCEGSVEEMFTCTIYQGQPVRAPASPNLPHFRVDHLAHAFQFTGLDFTGPVFVKDGVESNNKSYILLLTCASSHAIHLELVQFIVTSGNSSGS